MENKEYHPMLASSADPTKMSMTIKGILLALIPLIIGIAQRGGYTIAEGELSSLIQQGAEGFSLIMVVFGLVRKFYYSKK